MIDETLNGLDCYVVGGAVRDELLGIPVVERDWVIVGAHSADLLAAGLRQVHGDFPVFVHPKTGEEYALARRETKTGPGYRGFVVEAGPQVALDEDLARRDLTINAMARSADGTIVDPFGGRTDLAAGVLRHVTAAFIEDPVRLLRIARFAATLGRWRFRVAPETHDMLRVMAAGADLKHLTRERVWREMRVALGGSHPWRFFEVLQACGALARLLPELSELMAAQAEGPTAQSGRLREVFEAVQRQGGGDRACFAALWYEVAQQRGLDELKPWLPVERGFHELADQVLIVCPKLAALAAGDAHRWLELFNQQRGFAQPQRLAEIFAICRALAGQAYPAAFDELWQRALAAAAAVESKAVLAAGFWGADVGRELDRRRVAAIDRLLQGLVG